jgi:hypothetical protein
MPKPLYILCSESGSEDKNTGIASYFNVLDLIEIRELPKPPEGAIHLVQPIRFQIVAVWARTSEDDLEHPFQFTVSLFLPLKEEPLDLANGIFTFEKPRFRATTIVSGLIFAGAGVMRAESKIRKLGDGDESWLVQSYDVEVKDVRVAKD